MKKLTVYVDAVNRNELPCVLCAIRMAFQCKVSTRPIEMGYTEVTITALESQLADIESVLAPLV